MATEDRKRRDSQAVNVGLLANTVLAALKTTVGIIGHSPALLADGINSISDVAYGVVVAVFVRLAGKPADEQHPYGHQQMEHVAAVVVGSFVITTAVAIFWNAVNNVYDYFAGRSDFGGATMVALWVALGTVVVKVILTRWTRGIGQKTRNAAVLALAYDHRNDIFSAMAATVGILAGRMGYPWLDPLVGGIVAIIILRTGIKILQDSSADLMDTLPGESLTSDITAIVEHVEGVEQVEEVRAHRFGPYLVANITIGVDGAMSVKGGDEIATEVERSLCEGLDLMRRVDVHYHPSRGVWKVQGEPGEGKADREQG
jgi:cation diffusion facilitator family transporter